MKVTVRTESGFVRRSITTDSDTVELDLTN
jgi:hypothetical protein